MSKADNTLMPAALALDRDSSKPLYLQIYEELCDFLSNSDLKPGDRFPAELELVDKYDVARITVRRAIAEMVQEGRLVRKAGKGTFVAAPKIERQLVNVSSFSKRMEALGLQASSQVLVTKVVVATPRLSRELGVEQDSAVLALVRLRFSNQTPVAIENSYVSLLTCPDLDQVDFNTSSLYQVLDERYGLYPVKSEKTLELTTANAWEAKYLNVPQGSPLFLVRAQVHGEEKPIEYVKILLRGDRFRFRI
ncbi:GntR family transcriptional regulator [Aggregatilinea lenta]|uniref:GntR family transcriptional regulator n=1 Tax=Aggregatilinea lenta TaxID=913108 RepID=UPI000E5BBDAC|nr:GntR family transcriptional regulator [Aggregatilinea lenta]